MTEMSLDGFLAGANQEGRDFDFPMFAFLCRNPFKWFDEEVKPYFDYDVYQGRFERYQLDRNILVLKYETLKTEGVSFIREFIGRSDFELQELNVGEAKQYGELYREVRQTKAFPEAFVDYAYSTPYVLHFYSPEEIDQFRSLWR